MTEDELVFLEQLHNDNYLSDFEEWAAHMEASFADGEYSSFCA